jgi:hypothetical protein
MKTRSLLSLSLIVLLLAACAPGASATEPPPVALPTDTLAAPATEAGTQAAPAAEATALPVATSRGPDLHATNPTTVSLASGGLQFVEFFRFTWSTCRAMAPMVHGLEAKYSGRIQFTYLDADDPQTDDFQRTLGFYYQPEVYLLDAEGKVLQKWVGYTTQEDFEAVFAQYLQ